jgi:tetratricopeptide (TPR) repeat protein
MKHKLLLNTSRFCQKLTWVATGLFLLLGTTSCVKITIPLLQKGLSDVNSFPPLPAVSQGVLEREQKIHGLTLTQLTQFHNGPGVVINPPEAAQSSQTHFATGVGRWLEWSLGGVPQFDKNADWPSYAESMLYLQNHPSKSVADEAAILASMAGATNVATGTFSGTTTHLTLTYQWRKFPGNQLTGKPIVINGNAEEIIRRLPKLAQQLAAQLDIKSTFATPTENTAQMQQVGQFPLEPNIDLTDADVLLLAQLATVSHPAKLMYMSYLENLNHNADYPSYQTQLIWQHTADWLIKANPANALSWEFITRHSEGNFGKHDAQLISFAKAHPHNYLLNYSLRWLYTAQDKPQSSRDASEAALRSNRDNPRAWTQLAFAINDEADTVRQACFFSSLNDAQTNFIQKCYDEMIPFVREGGRLNQYSAYVGRDVSTGATFIGDRDLAVSAIQKALVDDPLNENALRWGVNIFQPKWDGSPGQLLPLTKTIMTHPMLYVRNFEKLNDAIYQSGFGLGREASRKRVKEVLENWLQKHPHDFAARTSYAVLLTRFDDWDGMEKQEEILIAQRPRDDVGYWLRATRLMHQNQYQAAGDYYKKALQFDPDNGILHYHLGETFHVRGEFQGQRRLFPQARAEYEASIKDDPLDSNNAEPYNRLADLYIYVFNDPQKAIDLYGHAISLVPQDGLYWANLGHAHFILGKKDLAKIEGRHAQRLGYTDQHILWKELQSM